MRTALLFLAACCACSREGPPASAPWFEEVAQSAGLEFRHMNYLKQRFWYPELMGAGLCWLDYDGDERPDLFVVQSGDLEPGSETLPGCKLFRNLGEGKFEDVTERAGVAGRGYGMGCTTGDYDGDGRVDLYVTCFGPDILYHNEGDGRFREVTAAAGVAGAGWGISCGFADVDADQDLDLVVVEYERWTKELELECKAASGERDYCAPNTYNAPAQCLLYVNDGQGRFHDGSAQAGLSKALGNGMGLGLADFDGDGRIDVYVSNDSMPNHLWINRGGGKFVEEALQRGCAVNRFGASQASMGTVVADLDEDRDLDIFITNLRYESTTVYENDGTGILRDVSSRSGMMHASKPFTGFGNGAFDFDLDGVLDLYVVNGRVGLWQPFWSASDIYAEPKQLFRGIDGKRFEEVPHGGLAADLYGTSRGAAFADYDGDGDVDVAVNESHGPLRLLRNVAPRQGHWIALDLRNRAGAPALQARVTLTAGKRTIVRDVRVCSSYASADDPRVHVGLGNCSAPGPASVRWPDGANESFGTLAADRIHVLRQGTGQSAR